MSTPPAASSPSAQTDRPNIVVILCDDMGYSDIGSYGSEIDTPNLDRLANNGLRFSQFYNCARCCPTRASLLTGLYPHQAGIGKMVNDEGYRGYRGYILPSTVTIAEALKGTGYRTLMAGKWHVGGQYEPGRPEQWACAGDEIHPTPTQRGFDDFYGTLTGAGSFWDPPTLMRGDRWETPQGDDYFYTDAIGDESCRMVSDALDADDPFFLYMAHTAPHWPLHARPETIEKYRRRYLAGWDHVRSARHERMRDAGLLNPAWSISPRDTSVQPWDSVELPDWEALRMATYAAMIDEMDQSIGRVLDLLDERGAMDNTLIMFLSDNGGCAEFLNEDGEPGTWPAFYGGVNRLGSTTVVGNRPGRIPGGPETFMSYDIQWANASNSPFRLYKSYTHEGGVATPMIMHWPAGCGPATRGGITHEPFHCVDIMATCLDAAGATYPSEYRGNTIQPTEGETFLPLLRGQHHIRSAPIFWEHIDCRGMRDGDWKLVWQRERATWELYNMAEDRTELHDHVASEVKTAERLQTAWQGWAERCHVFR